TGGTGQPQLESLIDAAGDPSTGAGRNGLRAGRISRVRCRIGPNDMLVCLGFTVADLSFPYPDRSPLPDLRCHPQRGGAASCPSVRGVELESTGVSQLFGPWPV